MPFQCPFQLMIVQFRVDCSVRVCVALVIVVNGVEVVKVEVDGVDVGFKVGFIC